MTALYFSIKAADLCAAGQFDDLPANSGGFDPSVDPVGTYKGMYIYMCCPLMDPLLQDKPMPCFKKGKKREIESTLNIKLRQG